MALRVDAPAIMVLTLAVGAMVWVGTRPVDPPAIRPQRAVDPGTDVGRREHHEHELAKSQQRFSEVKTEAGRLAPALVANERPDLQGPVTADMLEQALAQPRPVAYLLERFIAAQTLPERIGIIDAACAAVAHLTGERKQQEEAVLVSALLGWLSQADDERLAGHAFLQLSSLHDQGQTDAAFFTAAARAPTLEVRARCLSQLIAASQLEAQPLLLALLREAERLPASPVFAGLARTAILRSEATPAALAALRRLAESDQAGIPASLRAPEP
jgi:hypothetical protein